MTDDDPAVLLPCGCTGCVQTAVLDRCGDCDRPLSRPPSAGGCVCGGIDDEPYWTTV